MINLEFGFASVDSTICGLFTTNVTLHSCWNEWQELKRPKDWRNHLKISTIICVELKCIEAWKHINWPAVVTSSVLRRVFWKPQYPKLHVLWMCASIRSEHRRQTICRLGLKFVSSFQGKNIRIKVNIVVGRLWWIEKEI